MFANDITPFPLMFVYVYFALGIIQMHEKSNIHRPIHLTTFYHQVHRRRCSQREIMPSGVNDKRRFFKYAKNTSLGLRSEEQ